MPNETFPARFFARHSSEFFLYDIKQLTSPLPPAPAICKFVVEIERIHKHHVQAADPVFRRSVVMFAAAFEGLKSMRGPEEVARIRGKSVEEIVG